MDLTKILETRYSTKSFDPENKIPNELWSQLEDSFRLTASSTNIQPWHFIIASTEDGKKQMTKGTDGAFQFNTKKIQDASHVVLFCSKTEITEGYLKQVSEKEDSDGRYSDDESREKIYAGRSMFVNLHKNTLNDLPQWLEKQTYINIGSALLAAGVLGIDSLAMEGIDTEVLNNEFGLKEKGLTATAIVSFGYKSNDDFNASLPKSRLTEKELFTRI